LAESLPEASVRGVAAGLHATVQLPDGHDEHGIREEAGRRRLALATMSEYRIGDWAGPPTLILGYAQTPEPSIPAGVRELAEAVRAARDCT
jgi:GntR family transcriptional regulator/MocR family aminotransferase